MLPAAHGQDAAKKKIAQTNAFVERLNVLNAQADKDESMLRLSMDAKASVKVGEFSRNGVSRAPTQAQNHDFEPGAPVTPVGIFLPRHDALHLFAVTGKVTSDCLADFWAGQRQHFSRVDALVLNLDNGPERHSRRTKRRTMANTTRSSAAGACWRTIKNGSLLDSVEVVKRFAAPMTCKGVDPVVKWVTTACETGVKLT